jgi:hypothetical protein
VHHYHGGRPHINGIRLPSNPAGCLILTEHQQSTASSTGFSQATCFEVVISVNRSASLIIKAFPKNASRNQTERLGKNAIMFLTAILGRE